MTNISSIAKTSARRHVDRVERVRSIALVEANRIQRIAVALARARLGGAENQRRRGSFLKRVEVASLGHSTGLAFVAKHGNAGLRIGGGAFGTDNRLERGWVVVATGRYEAEGTGVRDRVSCGESGECSNA